MQWRLEFEKGIIAAAQSHVLLAFLFVFKALDGPMETHQLEAFSAVMSVGSVTGAGRLLNRSQPAVTRQIQELEADLGYTLFQRNGPRVTPTHEAFLLYGEVERSLFGLRTIEERARAIGCGTPQPVSIAATASLAASVIPAAFARALDLPASLSTDSPATLTASCTAPITSDRKSSTVLPQLQVRTQSAEHIVHAVLTHQADIGVVTLPIGHAGLDIHWIAEAPCVAAVHADSALAQQSVVALRDLSGQRIATVADRHRLRHRIDVALSAAGVAADICFESNNAFNALMTARTGAAVAIVDPATALGQDGNGLVIRPLDIAIPFLFGVITCAGRPRQPAVEQLLTAIRESTLALLHGVVMHHADKHDALLQVINAKQGDIRTAKSPTSNRKSS